jgi:hypothetical protein
MNLGEAHRQIECASGWGTSAPAARVRQQHECASSWSAPADRARRQISGRLVVQESEDQFRRVADGNLTAPIVAPACGERLQ